MTSPLGGQTPNVTGPLKLSTGQKAEDRLKADQAKQASDKEALTKARAELGTASAALRRDTGNLKQDENAMRSGANRLQDLARLLESDKKAGASDAVVADLKKAFDTQKADLEDLSKKVREERTAVRNDRGTLEKDLRETFKLGAEVEKDDKAVGLDQKVANAFRNLLPERAKVEADDKAIKEGRGKLGEDRTKLFGDLGKQKADQGAVTKAEFALRGLEGELKSARANGAPKEVISDLEKAVADQKKSLEGLRKQVAEDKSAVASDRAAISKDEEGLKKAERGSLTDRLKLAGDQKIVNAAENADRAAADRTTLKDQDKQLSVDRKKQFGDLAKDRADQGAVSKAEFALRGLEGELKSARANGAPKEVISDLEKAVADQKTALEGLRKTLTDDKATLAADKAAVSKDEAALKATERDLAAATFGFGRRGRL